MDLKLQEKMSLVRQTYSKKLRPQKKFIILQKINLKTRVTTLLSKAVVISPANYGETVQCSSLYVPQELALFRICPIKLTRKTRSLVLKYTSSKTCAKTRGNSWKIRVSYTTSFRQVPFEGEKFEILPEQFIPPDVSQGFAS